MSTQGAAFAREYTFQMQTVSDGMGLFLQLEAHACQAARAKINASLPGAMAPALVDEAYSGKFSPVCC